MSSPGHDELRRWREQGRAPAGSCPFCASRISVVERDGVFVARCSHRGCGARGPKHHDLIRACDLFCCPPQRTAGGQVLKTIADACDQESLGHLLDEMDEWIGRAGEAERMVEAARRSLSSVAESMTEHAYQELASALESPPRIAGKTADFDPPGREYTTGDALGLRRDR